MGQISCFSGRYARTGEESCKIFVVCGMAFVALRRRRKRPGLNLAAKQGRSAMFLIVLIKKRVIDSHLISIKPGTLVVISPGSLYRMDPATVKGYSLAFTEAFPLSDSPNYGHPIPVLQPDEGSLAGLRLVFDAMLAETGRSDKKTAIICHLLVVFLDRVDRLVAGPDTDVKAAGRARNRSGTGYFRRPKECPFAPNAIFKISLLICKGSSLHNDDPYWNATFAPLVSAWLFCWIDISGTQFPDRYHWWIPPNRNQQYSDTSIALQGRHWEI
jgi:hypothetical protein